MTSLLNLFATPSNAFTQDVDGICGAVADHLAELFSFLRRTTNRVLRLRAELALYVERLLAARPAFVLRQHTRIQNGASIGSPQPPPDAPAVEPSRNACQNANCQKGKALLKTSTFYRRIHPAAAVLPCLARAASGTNACPHPDRFAQRPVLLSSKS